MEPTTASDIFPALCVHTGDTFLDGQDGRIFRALSVSHTPGSWWVLIDRDDGTTRRYFISEPVRIYDEPVPTDAEVSALA